MNMSTGASLESADVWLRSLTLVERKGVLEQVAARRLALVRSWMTASGRRNDDWLSARAQAAGMSVSQLGDTLALDFAEPGQIEVPRPAWLSGSDALLIQSSRVYSKAPEAPAREFLTVLGGLIDKTILDSSSRSARSALFAPGAIEEAAETRCSYRFLTAAAKTLVLELNVARLEGRLMADHAEARFREFISWLGERGSRVNLFAEYPVLARDLVRESEHISAVLVECTGRFEADAPILRHHGLLQPEDHVVKIELGAGDTHERGRSVAFFRLASGRTIVYKPKSLSVDLHFQDLLRWLADRGCPVDFKTLTVVPRDVYGWTEFVPFMGCATREAARRFYWRQGAYLALLFAMEATDFHAENLIAHGEHPVMVDLEALFHQNIAARSSGPRALLAETVLRVGLLPQRLWGSREHEGVDFSGLGAMEGQLTPHPVPAWESAATDEMRLVRKRVPLPTKSNLPIAGGSVVPAHECVDDIVVGFSSTYTFILENSDAIIRGPLARFDGDEIRTILRPTKLYGAVLQDAQHPDVLRDALDRECLFNRLWQGFDGPSASAIYSSETDDLSAGDIPVFRTKAGSRSLWNSKREEIPDTFPSTGLERSARRIRLFSESDVQRQVLLIRASMLAQMPGVWSVAEPIDTSRCDAEPSDDGSADGPVECPDLIELADRVGHRLLTLAIEVGDEVNWVGLQLQYERSWGLAILGPDLYSGLGGVGVFLAYLSTTTHHSEYRRVASAIMRQLMTAVAPDAAPVGGFSGIASISLALLHLGCILDCAEAIEKGRRLLLDCAPRIAEDRELDVITGTAGFAKVLSGYLEWSDCEELRELAISCGSHLVASSHETPRGRAWTTNVDAQQPLLGLSHGTAGFYLGLGALSAATQRAEFLNTATEALCYEDSWFDPGLGNWPDFRTFGNSQRASAALRYMVAWCHGAPGIALARLAMFSRFKDRSFLNNVGVALQLVAEGALPDNQSLCHGSLGNLEPLQLFAALDGSSLACDRYRRVLRRVIQHIRRKGFRCGVPEGIETPGLMTGLAGIGYGLLRQALPEAIPSILLLDGPLQSSSVTANRSWADTKASTQV